MPAITLAQEGFMASSKSSMAVSARAPSELRLSMLMTILGLLTGPVISTRRHNRSLGMGGTRQEPCTASELRSRKSGNSPPSIRVCQVCLAPSSTCRSFSSKRWSLPISSAAGGVRTLRASSLQAEAASSTPGLNFTVENPELWEKILAVLLMEKLPLQVGCAASRIRRISHPAPLVTPAAPFVSQ